MSDVKLEALKVDAMYWNNQAQLYIGYFSAFKTSEYHHYIDEAQSNLTRIHHEILELNQRGEDEILGNKSI